MFRGRQFGSKINGSMPICTYNNIIKRNYSWNEAQQRLFGIELELIAPKSNIFNINELILTANEYFNNKYNIKFVDHKNKISNKQSNVWSIEKDTSLATNPKEIGFEIVSPILTYNSDTIGLIENLCDYLYNDVGCYNNLSCGFHIHFDANDLRIKDLTNICINYAYFEDVIDLFMNDDRKGNNNEFCRTLRHKSVIKDTILNKHWDMLSNNNSLSILDTINPYRKNHKINFRNAFYSRMNKMYNTQHKLPNTIENRHHHGTIYSKDIINWITFNMLFINSVLNKTDIFLFDDTNLNDSNYFGDEINNDKHKFYDTNDIDTDKLIDLKNELFNYINMDDCKYDISSFYEQKMNKKLNLK